MAPLLSVFSAVIFIKTLINQASPFISFTVNNTNKVSGEILTKYYCNKNIDKFNAWSFRWCLFRCFFHCFSCGDTVCVIDVGCVFFFPLYLQQICNHFALTNGQLSVENRSWKFPAKFLVFIVFISEFCKLFHPPATEAIVRNSSTICHHSNMINLINFPLPVDKWERGKENGERERGKEQ